RWGVEVNSCQFFFKGCNLLRKLAFQFSIQRRSRFAFLKRRDRIDRLSILRHLEVKVRSRCQAGLANQSYQFPLANWSPGPNAVRKVRRVSISARKPASVFDANEIAVTVVPSGKGHRPIRNGDNRTPRGSSIIRRKMSAFMAENWMHAAIVEPGSN